MEEGFEVYCAQSPESSSIGMNLILVLYELQCKRYIRINEKNQMREGFLSLIK